MNTYLVWVNARALIIAAALAAAGFLTLPSPGFAKPGTLRILAGGEDFEGPPNLLVRADATLLGLVPVKNAVDGASLKKMSEAEIAKTLQPYEFAVPSLETVGTFSIEFNNDRWGGDTAKGDRNLYIGGVSVGGTEIPLESMAFVQGNGKRVGTFAVLQSNGAIRISRPAQGWQPVAQAVAKPAACVAKSSIVLQGYAENQIGPGDGDASRLGTSLKTIAGLARCKIKITASTSPSGTVLSNARIAKARSDAVVPLLLKAGAVMEQISIQKPTSGDRGVIVSVSP